MDNFSSFDKSSKRNNDEIEYHQVNNVKIERAICIWPTRKQAYNQLFPYFNYACSHFPAN